MRPALQGFGTLVYDSYNLISLTNAPPSSLAAFFLALSSTPVPFKGGILKPFPFAIPPVFVFTSPIGTLPLPFVPSTVGIPAGTELWLQWAIQDPTALYGVSVSNAVKGVFPEP